MDSSDAETVDLVWLTESGLPQVSVDVASAMEGILLEQYHAGLEPTVEMRLPFNYSRLPPWVKGLARFVRKGSIAREPEVPFPPGAPFVVDWLCDLARWAGVPQSRRVRSQRWPDGRQAALTISHDVDTDWLFRNPDWIDRICDMEEEHGLFGAWYCVPIYSQSRRSALGIERLIERGCEIGCHGYNHDAKWPLLSGEKFAKRLRSVQAFRDRWKARGFRSEWLWRTSDFLSVLARVFDYDSSVPTASSSFTSRSRNGCGTCYPYLTYGDLVELPLTLPMDEARRTSGLGLEAFWRRQVERASKIIERGGLVMLSLHPQPHQAANSPTLTAVKAAIRDLVSIPNLWIARPDHIVDWVRRSKP
ncbi:MAG: hypothetical protein ABSG68_21590 [Thermoguttaceae bacterium]|jgi:peptidoglycan/xylan/chitin deacetylase (PgdA/CDA1 family)